nr:sulfotransferase family 2 domain-containing protein [Synechococcus sp. UW106]
MLQAKSKAIHQRLISLAPAQNSKPKKIAYLHIGKCAGTTLYEYFKNNKDTDITYLHMKRIEISEAEDYEFIFFIRHPISRFVSAFNHSKRIVEFDMSKLNINHLNHDNSYAPKRIKRKMLHGGVAFSKKYDQLTRHFKSANDLAESLYCEDIQQRSKAQKLMSLPKEHLFKGIGWYLHNGELIKRFAQNIKFVGCVETIGKDLQTACTLFKLDANPEQLTRKRTGLGSDQRQLSSAAIENLRHWYRDTDYQAIQLLHEHGLIQKEIRDYYQSSPYHGDQ